MEDGVGANREVDSWRAFKSFTGLGQGAAQTLVGFLSPLSPIRGKSNYCTVRCTGEVAYEVPVKIVLRSANVFANCTKFTRSNENKCDCGKFCLSSFFSSFSSRVMSLAEAA